MRTLHILRSEPDEQTRELILASGTGETQQIAIYEEPVDYDQLVVELFGHDRVISWW